MKAFQLNVYVLAGALGLLAGGASAQESNVASQPPTAVERSNPSSEPWQAPLHVAPRLEIGQATERLFAMQRNPANPRPRPIDGDQAARSYERYLKSFEREIPEAFEAGIDAKN